MAIDPNLMAAFGQGLLTVFGTLVSKGIIEPYAEKRFAPLVELLTRKYDHQKDALALEQAYEKALEAMIQGREQDRSLTPLVERLASLDAAAMQLLAAAAVEMEHPDPGVLPAELLKQSGLASDAAGPLVDFLSHLRRALADVPGYGNGIAYADRLAERGFLAGLARQVMALVLLQEQRLTLEQALLVARRLTTDDEAALHTYLEHLRSELKNVTLPLAKPQAAALPEAEVKQVFVPLAMSDRTVKETPAKKGRSARPPNGLPAGTEAPPSDPPHYWSLGETLARYSRLVLLGPPGSGKTTLLRRAALALAEGRAQQAIWAGRRRRCCLFLFACAI